VAKTKLSDKLLKDNPLGEIILALRGSAKRITSIAGSLENCFVTSLEASDLIVDPFLAKTVVQSIESDPTIAQYLNADTISGLKSYVSSECERVGNSFEARLRPFCEKNQISLEGRFPTYLLAGFLDVIVEQTKGICKIGGKPVKSLMLESIAPAILGTLKTEAERPFEFDTFLKELFEAYERVTRIKGMNMGQPAQILDVFRELVFIKQSPSFNKTPVKLNFSEYTKEFFSRDLARVSSASSTMGAKRLELMPTAFPHEEGLPIRIGDSTRYAGRITFNEVTG